MNEPMKQCSEFFGIPRKLPEFFSMNNSLVHLDLLDDNLDMKMMLLMNPLSLIPKTLMLQLKEKKTLMRKTLMTKLIANKKRWTKTY